MKLKTEGELDLVANTDVRIQFTEILTGEMMNDLTMPLKLWAHAVYSKYAVVPRGVNFGPMIYSSQRERSFELQNTGEFAFKYGLRDFDAEPTDESKGSELKLSNFTRRRRRARWRRAAPSRSRSSSTPAPTRAAFRSMVAIDVADREPSHDPSGLQYELIGESCIPGIDTSDWQSTFEEQAVVRRVDLSSSGLPKNIFSEEDKLFCFGSHMVAQDVTERFKLTNPFKVECTVNLSVKPRALKGGGGGGKAGEETPLAIEIEPSKILLPPHEHRYISAIFTPPAMQTFHARLRGGGRAGRRPGDALLTFDVVGEGTLPHVLVAQPAARTEDGLPVIAFPKLLVGRSKTLPAQLVNEGILPASVRLALSGAPAFSCSLVGQAITIDPKSSQTIDVKFEPRPIDAKEAEDGGAAPPVEAKISLTVAHNAFEDNTIVLNGSAYAQDVAFEEMPGEGDGDGGSDERLPFGDVEVGQPKSLTFSLRNYSATPRRFEWSAPPGITFARVGRPPAAARRQVDHRHLPLGRARRARRRGGGRRGGRRAVAARRREGVDGRDQVRGGRAGRLGRHDDGGHVAERGGVPRARGAPRGGEGGEGGGGEEGGGGGGGGEGGRGGGGGRRQGRQEGEGAAAKRRRRPKEAEAPAEAPAAEPVAPVTPGGASTLAGASPGRRRGARGHRRADARDRAPAGGGRGRGRGGAGGCARGAHARRHGALRARRARVRDDVALAFRPTMMFQTRSRTRSRSRTRARSRCASPSPSARSAAAPSRCRLRRRRSR